MTILFTTDATEAERLSPALEGDVRTVQTLREAAETVDSDPTESLVVLGGDLPLDDACGFSAHVRHVRPQVAVVLLNQGLAQREAAAALDAGIREVVRSDDLTELAAACRRARAHDASILVLDAAPAEQPVGCIITVFSPKGGSGKTTVATNLAVALHGNGSKRVCLLDLDLEFGDVAISLGLTPTKSLIDAVTTEVNDGDDMLSLLTTEYRPGLDCILAPIEPGEAAKIVPELVADLLALLRTSYDMVVIDTPSQISEHVLTALDASDHHVLLTNPEIPSLKNLRLTLDMLDLLGYPRSARSIVFNRVDDAAGLTAADVEEALNMPIAVHVPVSRDIPQSINRGIPIVASHSDHPVSVPILTFASEVIIGAPLTRKRSGLSKLFRRRSA